MKIKFLGISIMLLMPACSEAECNGNFYLSSKFSSIEYNGIETAVLRMNRFIGRNIIRTDDTASQCKIMPGHCRSGGLACYDHVSGSITIDSLRLRNEEGCEPGNQCFENVVIHELGHALGFEHVSHKGDIMSEKLSHYGDFTDLDRQECERTGICTR